MRKEILRILDNETERFIAPEWSDFKKFDYGKLVKELFKMVEEGILIQRDCMGLAFEYPNQTTDC